jgi:ATP-dependent Clp protease ATP-binding subunit ClpC
VIDGSREHDEPDAARRAEPPAASPNTPTIDALGRDLTALARAGRLPEVCGREAEMTAVARYLSRTSKRNVIITGEAGVGKTAVVEGLARRLADNSAPEFLRRLRIVQINAGDLAAAAKYRGDLEEKMKLIAAEAAAAPEVVLFFDDIHLLKSGPAADSPADTADLMKPALASDAVRCVGTTTNEEFERHLSGDPEFMRSFQVIRLAENTEEEAIAVCRQAARRIEEAQQVEIEDDAVAAAVTLSARLIRGRALPDKAIDLLENAAAYVKVTSLSFSEQLAGVGVPKVGREHVLGALEEQYSLADDSAPTPET